MKAAYHTGKKLAEIKETDRPTPGPGEYLVQIKACAICGSDTWWNNDASETEPVHGHESAGVVVECGPGTEKYKVGDHVVCYAILGCGECEYCKAGNPTNCQKKKFVEGGFQEYSVFNEALLFPCPEGMDFVTASLLSDAIGVPLRGLRRLEPKPDDKVCVWGLGPLGMLQIMFLKAKGVKTIIALDLVEERMKKALELGATHAVNATNGETVSEVKKICGEYGADKVYSFVRNAKATEKIFKSSREGASICTYVGFEGEFNLPEWYERTVVWSFYFTPEEYEENVKFIQENGIDLKSLVSDVYPLEKINEAFSRRFDQADKSLKIVVSMEQAN